MKRGLERLRFILMVLGRRRDRLPAAGVQVEAVKGAAGVEDLDLVHVAAIEPIELDLDEPAHLIADQPLDDLLQGQNVTVLAQSQGRVVVEIGPDGHGGKTQRQSQRDQPERAPAWPPARTVAPRDAGRG